MSEDINKIGVVYELDDGDVVVKNKYGIFLRMASSEELLFRILRQLNYNNFGNQK